MRRSLAVGALFCLIFAIAFAPASLLRSLVPSQVVLLNPTGTLWRGSSQLIQQSHPLGELRWRISPAALLRGSLRYDLVLDNAIDQLSGAIELAPWQAATRIEISGALTAVTVNQWLLPYHIDLSGIFTLENVQVTLVEWLPAATKGTIVWSGGRVTYTLSGKTSSSILPEMRAYLGEGPEAVVYPIGGQTPLLYAELLATGYAKVGITMRLTRLLNDPWPGGEPDHAVVLEVEEQVF